MRKLFYGLALAVLLLGLVSCDRYEHAFNPGAQVDFAEELFTPLQTGFDNVTSDNLSSGMAFYAEDYFHYGLNKSEWEAELHTMLTGVANPVFEVSFSATGMLDANNAVANWRLIISDPATKVVLADSNYVGERLIKQNNQWLLRGNQQACNPPAAKQPVIVEYITNVGCSYCPAVEAELHELAMFNPGKLIYLTHQLSGPVMITDPLFAYYSAFSAPVSIIQGQFKLSSGTEDVIAQYEPLINSQLSVDSQMDYQFINTLVSGNNLSGSVQLTPKETGFDQSNLVLNLVIIDKISTATNVSGDPLTNIVIGRNRIDVSSQDFGSPITFNFNANVSIPDDAALVVFAQKTPSVFANNAVIYSGLEIPINRRPKEEK